MKLGLNFPLEIDRGHPDPYWRFFSLCVAAEEAGFDYITIGQHHFRLDPGDEAAPFVALGAVAARTSTIKLATSIFLLPLHHPVHVAEQVAVLDQISNGRAILGVGLGFRDYEFAAYEIEYSQRGSRFNEALDVINHAWKTGEFAYSGKHFNIPTVPVDPMPVQNPRPPIWVGGTVDAALKRAARYGDGWLADPTLPIFGHKERAETYRKFCAELGTGPGTVQVSRFSCLAESRREVEEKWFPGVLEFYRHLVTGGGVEAKKGGEIAERLAAGESVELMEFTEDRAIAGTPEDCIRQIKRWESELGASSLLLILSGDGGYEAQMRTIKLYGKEVIPHI